MAKSDPTVTDSCPRERARPVKDVSSGLSSAAAVYVGMK